MKKITLLAAGLLILGASGCANFSLLGTSPNAPGASVKVIDLPSDQDIVYQAPDITTNGLFTLGSTWTQLNSRLEARKNKKTGAVAYQAVLAVNYLLRGKYNKMRYYKWADVDIASGTALQRLFIQDAKDFPLANSDISDCAPIGLCKQETLTVAVDDNVLKRANNDLLVQVHSGRDADNVPLYPALAAFSPSYVTNLLQTVSGQPANASR